MSAKRILLVKTGFLRFDVQVYFKNILRLAQW